LTTEKDRRFSALADQHGLNHGLSRRREAVSDHLASDVVAILLIRRGGHSPPY